jgi:hypothetical protein
MSPFFAFWLAISVVIFLCGGVARTYENFKISQSSVRDWDTWITERRYMRLVRESGAPLWPVVVASICLPLGMLVGFASAIWFGITMGK